MISILHSIRRSGPTRRCSFSAFASLLFLVGGYAGAQSGRAGQPVRLRITTAPALVDCAPVTQTPCMGAGVTPVDSNGNPAPIVLPPKAELASTFSLQQADRATSDARVLTPFYASAGSGPDAGQHSNVSLLLVDISGSMNQPAPGSVSRIAAVKEALGRFVDGMQEGTDRIAIVPFQSHNVTSTIRSAVYARTKADAMAQLNSLPAPVAQNNTALYQAVFSGVQSLQDELNTLQHEGHGSSELEPHLILMTDGKNEVLPGDDPQLLNGDLGLQQAAAQVQSSHLDVVGIGFGDRASIDAAAMQRLSSRFFYAADADQLLAALHVSRSAASHEIQLLWLLPPNGRLALMGQDPAWIPAFHPSAHQTLLGDTIRVLGPATGAPVFDRRATEAELQALIQIHPSADSGWSVVLIYYLLTLAVCALLLMLWFWVPRLVWGDRFLANVPQRSKRWSQDRSPVTSASGVQIRPSSLPAGFDAVAPNSTPLQRSAAQTTQLQPRGEFSRTRLTFDQN